MIFKKLVVGALATNCYIFGSDVTKEVVIIDPGGDDDRIIEVIEELGAKPIAVLLTHGHFDHTLKVGKIQRQYKIPLMYNKREKESGIFSHKDANNWLKEGDFIDIGEMKLHVLETPGHSPGSLCFYSNDVHEFEKQKIDGILFSGDLIFRQSIGRSDFEGGDQKLLFSSIKHKIMYNKSLTDDFLICSGHMGLTSIGFERQNNMFKSYFL